jgi:hypothetical protein
MGFEAEIDKTQKAFLKRSLFFKHLAISKYAHRLLISYCIAFTLAFIGA